MVPSILKETLPQKSIFCGYLSQKDTPLHFCSGVSFLLVPLRCILWPYSLICKEGTFMSSAAASPSAGLSGTALKRIACVSMLLDHIGASCLESGLLAPAGIYGTWLSLPPAGLSAGLTAVYWADIVLRLAGRIAFPIYCFLLVEGFCHTHDVRRYAVRLAAFAFLSEIPFDAAFFGTAFTAQYQNVYFTLALGLFCLILLRRFAGEGLPHALLQLCAVLFCGSLAALLHTDYDFFGVAFIAMLYLLRAKPRLRTVLGCTALVWEYTAPLAFIPIHAYNGARGRCPKWEQYGFYAFYPVHLAVLALITNFLLR